LLILEPLPGQLPPWQRRTNVWRRETNPARGSKLLFDRDDLAKNYAEKLNEGWFFGINNSANETNTWLERACSCAGMTWGQKFKTSLTPSIDDL
jgi:hypothetical protein